MTNRREGYYRVKAQISAFSEPEWTVLEWGGKLCPQWMYVQSGRALCHDQIAEIGERVSLPRLRPKAAA